MSEATHKGRGLWSAVQRLGRSSNPSDRRATISREAVPPQTEVGPDFRTVRPEWDFVRRTLTLTWIHSAGMASHCLFRAVLVLFTSVLERRNHSRPPRSHKFASSNLVFPIPSSHLRRRLPLPAQIQLRSNIAVPATCFNLGPITATEAIRPRR